ncbi:MAG: methyltransferase domain-containing protein, partial [Gammaproteobacteria bacterium]|nr:methyltransferase domain-containing protein [Gammaproteobacteria bacterium]
LAREKLGIPDVHVVCNKAVNKSHLRAFPFIEMYPFLNASWDTDAISHEPDAKKIWLEAYVKRGQTIFKDAFNCDYFMSYNGRLEAGDSLEEVDPDLACNWNPPRFISLEEENYRKQSVEKYGKYIVFLFVFQGTFKFWEEQFSIDNLIAGINKITEVTGSIPVFIGGTWDNEDSILTSFKEKIQGHIDLTGKTTVAQAFGLLRGSEAVMGYPCGMTMMGAALGKKTFLLWNDWHRYGFHWNVCPPTTKNVTYFIENTKALTVPRFVEKAIGLIENTSVDSLKTMYDITMHDVDTTKAAESLSMYGIEKDKRVLDVFSGSGAFVGECRNKGANAYGCEVQKYGYGSTEINEAFVYKTIMEDTNFPTDHFDVVVCQETFGHVVNIDKFMNELFRITKQEGKCFIHFSKRYAMNVWSEQPPEIEKLFKKIGFHVDGVKKISADNTIICLSKPKQIRPTILVPPGIGDCFWSIIKLQAFLKREKLSLPDIHVVSGKDPDFEKHKRAFPFIEMFPFINASWNTIDDADPAKVPLWDEAYRSRGRTIFKNALGFDYFICYNGHLRHGDAVEDIDPDLTCDWNPLRFISLEEQLYEKESVQKYGKYILFYFPFQGTYQHWTNDFSVDNVIRSIRKITEESGCTPVFVGANWDMLNSTLRNVIRNIPQCIDLTGKTTIPQAFGLISGSQLVVGYPSGLTIMAATFGNKTLMIWNSYYHSNLVWNSCPKAVKDKTYFAETTKGLTVKGITSCALSILNETPFPGRPITPGIVGRHKERGKTVIDRNMRTKWQIKRQMLLDAELQNKPVKVPKPIEPKPIEPKPIEPKPIEEATKLSVILKSASVIVACVLKLGSIFKDEDVLCLKNMVARCLQVKHDFVCLTDSVTLPTSIISIPLINGWPGWWSKMELFHPNLFCNTPTIYFDLDTVLIRSVNIPT